MAGSQPPKFLPCHIDSSQKEYVTDQDTISFDRTSETCGERSPRQASNKLNYPNSEMDRSNENTATRISGYPSVLFTSARGDQAKIVIDIFLLYPLAEANGSAIHPSRPASGLIYQFLGRSPKTIDTGIENPEP